MKRYAKPVWMRTANSPTDNIRFKETNLSTAEVPVAESMRGSRKTFDVGWTAPSGAQAVAESQDSSADRSSRLSIHRDPDLARIHQGQLITFLARSQATRPPSLPPPPPHTALGEVMSSSLLGLNMGSQST